MPSPPFELMGWLGPEVAEPEFARLASNFMPFNIYGTAEAPIRTSPGPPIWDFAKRVNGGKHLPTWRQESGDCFPAGTVVQMANGIEKPIESICVGEFVRTHLGNVKRITNTIKKSFTGHLVEIMARGYCRSITATPDHEFIAYPGIGYGRSNHTNKNRFPQWNAIGQLQKNVRILLPYGFMGDGDLQVIDVSTVTGRSRSEDGKWVQCKPGKYRVFSKIPVDNLFARLFGIYLAEGGITKDNGHPQRVDINLGRHETELANEVAQLFETIFNVKGKICHLPSKPSVTIVRCCSAIVARIFKWLCPGNTWDKSVPEIFFGSMKNVRTSLIRGWCDGDGHDRVNIHKNSGTLKVSGKSVCDQLCWDIYRLAMSCQLKATITKSKPSGFQKTSKHKNGSKEVNFYGGQALQLYPKHSHAVSTVCTKIGTRKKCETKLGLAQPIKSIIAKEVVDEIVYCLGVEDDHSFIANGYAVHNCVSMGCAQAGQYMSVFEIAVRGQEEMFKWWYPPFIYGASRVQVGGGRLRGPGSTGAWGATAMMKYGVLFADDPGVPRYSKQLADQWGGRPGPPTDMFNHAKDNLVGSAARLSTVSEIREALINYKMVTIASGRGFQMQPSNYKGHHVFRPEKEWPHQMCFIGWMDEPFAAAYRLNSWGDNAHGSPLNGEPPGGAWNLADDLEYELKKYGCEVYALSLFQGFPAPPNFSIL